MCNICGSQSDNASFAGNAAQGTSIQDIIAAVQSTNLGVAQGINAAPTGPIGALAGAQWSDTDLTFSFGNWSSSNTGSYGGQISDLDAQSQQAVRDMLDLYADVSGLTFTEVSGVGDIELRMENMSHTSVGGYAYLPSNGGVSRIEGNVTLDTEFGSITDNSFSYFAAIHELGHAMGMNHPFSGSSSTPSSGYIGAHLNAGYSVMSYSDGGSSGQAGDIARTDVTGLQLYDIATMQYLYGANYDYQAGDDVYTFDTSGARQAFAMWDGGGNDTFDASNISSDVKIDLRDGDYLNEIGVEAIKIAYGAVIENAVAGDGDDSVRGNVEDNYLYGGHGSDSILGDAGDDVIMGGKNETDASDASDELIGGDGDDIIFGNGGDDTIIGGDGYTDTTDGNDILYGGVGNDALYGNAGDDVLIGASGNDLLYGGRGDDTYVIGWGNDEDTIFGFEDGDKIRILNNVNNSGITDFDSLMQNAVTDGTHTAFMLDGHAVIVTDHTLGDFDAGDFEFV